MIKVLQREDFKNLEISCTIYDLETEIINFITEQKLFKRGLFLEYYEDEFTKFNFIILGSVIFVYKSFFTEQFNKDEIKTFLKTTNLLEELKETLKKDIIITLNKTLTPDSKKIKNIYKFKTSYFRFKKYSGLYEEYTVKFYENSFQVRCLPYTWGNSSVLLDSNTDIPEEYDYRNDLFLIAINEQNG